FLCRDGRLVLGGKFLRPLRKIVLGYLCLVGVNEFTEIISHVCRCLIEIAGPHGCIKSPVMHGHWKLIQHYWNFMGVGGFPHHRISLGAVRALQIFKYHDSHRRPAGRLEKRGIGGKRADGKREKTDQDNGIEQWLHERKLEFSASGFLMLEKHY